MAIDLSNILIPADYNKDKAKTIFTVTVNNCSASTTIYTHTCQAVEFQEITSEPSDMNLETIYFLNPSSTSSVIVSNAATAEISNPS